MICQMDGKKEGLEADDYIMLTTTPELHSGFVQTHGWFCFSKDMFFFFIRFIYINDYNRPTNGIIPTTPEPPPLPSSEPTSPSGSGSPPNIRTESPTRCTPEWNGDGTPSRTPSRDSSTPNTPRNTPTQQQNRNQQNQHNTRNVTPASSRERRPVRASDEQNGNQNGNARPERGINNAQPRRPNRSNRNRNSALVYNERRYDPPQPPDLPRGYGKYQN